MMHTALKPRVGVNLYGGLGNKLFQRAAAIGYAKKHDSIYVGEEIRFFNPQRTLKEESHSYSELPAPYHSDSDIVLDGYFQSEKYFAHCKEEIQSHFTAPLDFQKGVASIHVRRGDYLLYPTKHPVIPIEYIEQAIAFLYHKGVSSFQIFSDDITWCKKEFSNMSNGYYDFMPKATNPMTDIWRMARCEHNIIANSTFSWWGAWLNPNPDKIVISPSKDNWFGPGNAHLDTKDIIPDNWIQIKY